MIRTFGYPHPDDIPKDYHIGEEQNFLTVLYSCPLKTHHPSDALSCDLSKVVHKCVMYIDYLGQMHCFRTKITSRATALT